MKINIKSYGVVLLDLFDLNKKPLFLWLIIKKKSKKVGGIKSDSFKDKREKLKQKFIKPIKKRVLHELVSDTYCTSVETDIQELESIVSRSVFDLFDDDPVFSRFVHLRSLARNRDFEKKYYGKIR